MSLSVGHERIELHAPAKVNLRLKIIGRRSDGYHELSMINGVTSFGDLLSIELLSSPPDEIVVETGAGERMRHLEDTSKNLASRAFRKCMQLLGLPYGSRIRIRKRIPEGGGLGGGSSNAAAVVHYCSRYLVAPEKRKFFDDALTTLLVELGADVPFLYKGGLHHVTGIGEVLTPFQVSEMKTLPLILIFPKVSFSTKDMFANFKLRKKRFSPSEAFFQRSYRYDELFRLIDNDFLSIARQTSPLLAKTYEHLQSLSVWKVSMSGSGSTLFLIPNNPFTTGLSDGEREELHREGSFFIETELIL